MGALRERVYTIEDIYALPEGERAELIGGELFMMAPPALMHQRILSELHLDIGSYIRSRGGKCEIFPAPFAVFLEDDAGDEDYVEPDLCVVCDPQKLDEKGCHGAPDWVIEIVSPSTRKMDYARKQFLYYRNGVKEYWIVDPARDTVTVYRAEEDWIPVIYRFGDKVRAGIYEDLELIVK